MRIIVDYAGAIVRILDEQIHILHDLEHFCPDVPKLGVNMIIMSGDI